MEGLGTSYEHSRAINHSCHNTCRDLHSKHCYVAMTLVPRLPTRRISKTPGPLSSQCLESRMRTKRPQPHGIAQHAEVSRQGFKFRAFGARQGTADRPGGSKPNSMQSRGPGRRPAGKCAQLLGSCTAWIHAAPASGGASGRRQGEPAEPPAAIQDPHG